MAKSKKKQPEKKSSLLPTVALVLGALVLVGNTLWLFLKPDATEAPAAAEVPETDRPAGVPADWVPLVSRQHGFRVYLPSRAQDVTSSAGGGPVSAAWAATHATGTFTIIVSRCPPELCQKTPDTLLKSARESAIEEVGGTVKSQRELQLPCPQGSCPGTEFEATSRQGLPVVTRFFIANDRVFNVSSMLVPGATETYQKVVDSFSFL
jgi:hypothetical protein